MDLRIRTTLATMLMVHLVLVIGCSKSKPVAVDTAPFEAAIVAYLDEKNMGMAIAEFKTVEITGNSATAVCSMEEASGLYGMKVQWAFTFQRADANANWVVARHEKK